MKTILRKLLCRFSPQASQSSPDNDVEARIEASADELRALKNKYQGRRGFVIGNGPSLRVADLDLLKDEVTIASNKIFMAFDEVQWRPTIYTIVDDLVWDKIYQDLPTHELVPIIPSYLPEKPIPHLTARYLGNAPDLWSEGKGNFFSTDASEGLYGGYTVTFENLQLAVHMGLDPIYIIGCDHYYFGEEDVESSETPIVTKSTNNHFLPNYRNHGEIVSPASLQQMTTAYEVAARHAAEHGLAIKNATRGGHLEAFPRQDFNSLFR